MQKRRAANRKRRLRPYLAPGSAAPRLVSLSESESDSKRRAWLFLNRKVLCGVLADLPQADVQAASGKCQLMSRALAGQGP